MGEESGTYRIFLTGQDESLRKEFQECLSKLKPDTAAAGDPILLQLCAVHCLETVTAETQDAIIFILDYFGHTSCTEVAKVYRDLRGCTGFGYLGLVCGSQSPSGSLEDRSGQIEKTIRIEEDLWEKPLRLEIQHLKNANSTAANKERSKQLQHWADSAKIVYHISVANFCDKKDAAVNDMFKAYRRWIGVSNVNIRSSASFSVQKVSHNLSGSLPLKAPALHWTNWPLAEELQVTWRFKFLCGEPPDSWFSSAVKECIQKASACEYTYQWIDGLFFQFDSVKVCAEREKNKFDLSVRCDPEEMGESPTSAANLLWHYLAPFLHAVFLSLDSYPRIPFQIHLVPVGNVFYSAPVSVETSFDMTTIFGAIENQKYTGFKMTDVNNSSDPPPSSDRIFFIERCLPGVRPRTLAELKGHLKTLAAHSKATRKASHPVVSMSADAARAANFLNVQEADNQSKRRRSLDGRRVSFGHVLIENQKQTDVDQKELQDATDRVAKLSPVKD